MQKENLFFWPLCLYTYAPGEGNDWQFPFPNYENGDIFLSWGSVAVKAYAGYKPELALKYVKNVLAQYAKDGLAFQRYARAKQDGQGDDILSGNSLSVVGLYQGIYGINPLYNRFYLDPHITKELEGTEVKYNYRNQKLTIELAMGKYAVSNSQFKILDKNDFGFYGGKNELLYFHKNSEVASLKIATAANLSVEIKEWDKNRMIWIQSSKDIGSRQLIYQANDLNPNSTYNFSINSSIIKRVKSNSKGELVIPYKISNSTEEIKIAKI
jgi:hypothetical protein